MTDWRNKLLASLLPAGLLVVALLLVFWHVQRPGHLIYVWIPWARVGALALVMTAIIITGGIDLSVGSMMALSGVLAGVLWRDAGWSIELALMAGVLCGLAAGAGNGLLVLTGISPLVATLATMALYRGLAMTLSRAESIRVLPDQIFLLRQSSPLPNEYWLLILVFLGCYVMLHHMRMGRWCFAIGDNQIAARYAAVPVGRTRFCLYALSGLVAGLTGVLAAVEAETAWPDGFQGAELQAIASVVVGGALITGGRGSMPRTLLGVVIISHLDEGLKSLSTSVPALNAETRLILMGALVIAVAVWNEWLAQNTNNK